MNPAHYERSYERNEPGYALEGYLHHVEGAIARCMQVTDHAVALHQEAESKRFELNSEFVKVRDRYRPFILKWHAELVTKGRELGLLPELSPRMEKIESALEQLFEGAADTTLLQPPQSSDEEAYRVVTGKAPPPAGLNDPVRIDDSVIRQRVRDAVGAMERFQELWPLFDPGKERVDRALVPWEQAYELAVQINDDTSELIQKTAADSMARIKGSERLLTMIEQDLKSHWTRAVQHAFTVELATRIDAAFLRVRDAARDATVNIIRMRQRGDQTWPEVWGTLNSAVLAMQDLRPLLRRAVMVAREEAVRDASKSLGGEPGEVSNPHQPDGGRWFPAAWYGEHTKQALYADLLRVAASRELILGRKVGKRRQYEFTSVCRQYPQYRSKLEAAAQPEPRRTGTNRDEHLKS